MPGKMTRPDDGRRNNPGGYRGGGRPRLTDPSESKARKIHQVRAHDDEWVVIKDFIKYTRIDMSICRQALHQIENSLKAKQVQSKKEAEELKVLRSVSKESKAMELSKQGMNQTEIAEALGVSQAHVSRLLNPYEKKTEITPATQKKIDEIKELAGIGFTQADIAKRLGVSQSRVSQLLRMS